jgi:hypothetical protein
MNAAKEGLVLQLRRFWRLAFGSQLYLSSDSSQTPAMQPFKGWQQRFFEGILCTGTFEV